MTDIMETLQCLARLKHEGFDIVPWNFDEFKAPQGVPVFVDECISVIDTYYGHANFISAYMNLEKLCLLYTSPSPRDATLSRMPSSA